MNVEGTASSIVSKLDKIAAPHRNAKAGYANIVTVTCDKKSISASLSKGNLKLILPKMNGMQNGLHAKLENPANTHTITQSSWG